MIIVSQDKKKIINFDNIVYMDLGKSDGKCDIYINANQECEYIGSYDTEERAKEVFQEIARVYADLDETVDNADGRARYIMPKE